MGFLRDIFKTRAKDWIFKKLEDSQTPDDSTTQGFEPNKYYLEIWLKSLRIVDIRRGFNKFHPIVHSYTSLPYLGKKEDAEFNMVTKPGKLEELTVKNLDRMIKINKPMLDKIPFRGGNIDLDIGLYSIKNEDLAGPYLTLIEDISSLAGVSFISQALTFAEPLKTGINLLTGGQDDTVFEIGLSTTFEGEKIETGFYIVMRAEENDIDVSQITVDPDDFKLSINGKKIKDCPYLVFEIKRTTEKNDWWKDDKINSAYLLITDAFEKGNIDELTSSFQSFKRVVRSSPNLLTNDKVRIIEEVENNLISPYSKEIATSKIDGMKIPKLKDYSIY